MTAKIELLLDRLKMADTHHDLQKLVELLRDIYDVEHAVYHAINGAGDQFAALTYDAIWEPRYREMGYVATDPVVRGALRQFHPLEWKQLDWSGKAERRLFAEAVEAGIGNQGYSIPIRGPNGQFALFTINQTTSDEKWARHIREISRDMLLAGHFIHHQAMAILSPEDITSGRDLSPRERDALTLLGVGHSRGQVADRLQISEHTLRVYIDTARHKLGALNTTHAVALAFKQGKILI